jgi:hypothetical protein
MPDIFVAFSGTPEASTADFVCDGSSDDIEFQAAIAAAQAGGGGTVHFGAGTYSISQPVVVEGFGIHLQGAGAGETTFEVAGDWQSLLHPNGAHLAGAITFVACDNFSANGITVDADTNSVHCNGIVAIPDGANGNGTPCTNGVISGNEVFLTQAHDYSIWSLRGQHIQISDNLVDGGSSPTVNSPHQEGIEVYGGTDVSITGNTVRNVGGAAINIGGMAADTPDSSVEGILVDGNVLQDVRIGVALGTTYDPVTDTHADLKGVSITDNQLERVSDYGFYLRQWTGSTTNPPVVQDLLISGNTVTMVVTSSASVTGTIPAALQIMNTNGLGSTTYDNIVVSDNHFLQELVAETMPAYFLPSYNRTTVLLFQAENVTFSGNTIISTATAASSSAITVFDSNRLDFQNNNVDGAGTFALEVYGTSALTVHDNTFSNWNQRLPDLGGLLLSGTPSPQVSNNVFESGHPVSTSKVIQAVAGVDVSGITGNTYVSSDDAVLGASARVDNIVLADSAASAIGNGASNILTGNEIDNVLRGMAGSDNLSGAAGDDWLDGGAGADVLDGGDGFDWAAHDSATSSVSIDLANLAASTGDAAGDTYLSIEGISGSAFNDSLQGSTTADSLAGQAGNDVLNGRDGDDTLLGGDGVDHLIGGAGRDSLDGGAGYDYARYSTAASGITADLTNSLLNTGDAEGDTFASIEGLIGSAHDDVLRGDASGNDLVGHAGDDILQGRDGNDGLQGGAGNDRLDGGEGSDYLSGGSGADTFVFGSAPGSGAVDTITDYESGEDRIELAAGQFGDLLGGTLAESALHIGGQGSAMTQDTRIVYEPSTGALFFDADGSGAQAAMQFALLSNAPSSLQVDDFTIGTV